MLKLIEPIMRKVITLIVLISCLSTSFAQKDADRVAKMTVGVNYDRYSLFYDKFNFVIGENIIVINSKKDEIAIQIFDKTTLEIKVDKVHDDIAKKFEFQNAIAKDGKLYMFYLDVVKKPSKHHACFVTEINIETGDLGVGKVLAHASSKVRERATGLGIKATTKYKRFYDYSKVFIVKLNSRNNWQIDYTLASKNILGFAEFDASFNKIQGTEYKLPKSRLQLKVLSNVVTTNGKSFVIAIDKTTNYYVGYSVTNKGKVKAVKLNLNDITLQMPLFKTKANGNILLASYYFQTVGQFKIKGGHDSEGIYYAELTSDGEIVKESKIKFKSNISYKVGADTLSPENKTIDRFLLKDFEILKDGSIYLAGQQAYVVHGGDYTSYVVTDIIATKLSADGELLWMSRFFGGGCGLEGSAADYINGESKMFYLGVVDGNLCTTALDKKTGGIEVIEFFNKSNLNKTEVYQSLLNEYMSISDNEFYLEIPLKGKKGCVVKFKI